MLLIHIELSTQILHTKLQPQITHAENLVHPPNPQAPEKPKQLTLIVIRQSNVSKMPIGTIDSAGGPKASTRPCRVCQAQLGTQWIYTIDCILSMWFGGRKPEVREWTSKNKILWAVFSVATVFSLFI